MRKSKLLFVPLCLMLCSCGNIEEDMIEIKQTESETQDIETEVSETEDNENKTTEAVSEIETETEEETIDYRELGDDINPLVYSDDYLESTAVSKNQNFNGALNGTDYFVVGEFYNKYTEPIDVVVYYYFYNEDGQCYSYGYDEQPYLAPGEQGIFIAQTDEAGYYALEYQLSLVSESIKYTYENINIESVRNSDNSISSKVSSGSIEDLSGTFLVFFYDENNDVIAYDTVGFGGELPWELDFDSPSVSYDHYFLQLEIY